MNKYYIGDLVQIAAQFMVTADGAFVDPTTVTFVVLDPTGERTYPSVSNPSVGNYTAQVPATVDGTWRWQAVGTGSGQAVSFGQFIVQPNLF